MAIAVLRGSFPRANPLVAQVRAAHLARVEQARDRAIAKGTFGTVSLPSSLIELGCWLVINGCTDAASEAELQMGCGPDTYRAYLARLDARGVEQEMAGALRTIYAGRHPIVRPVAAPALREAA